MLGSLFLALYLGVNSSVDTWTLSETLGTGARAYLELMYTQLKSSASDILRSFPKGPCTQYLGTWDIGNCNYSIGFGVSI